MSSPADSGANGIPRCVKYTLLGVGAVAAAAGAALYYRRKANAKKQVAANPHRLPEDVAPVHYDLKLTPDMRTEEEGGTGTFQGEVRVLLKIHKPTSVIKLNALDLKINSVSVLQNSTLITAKFDEIKDEVLTIHLDSPVQEGRAHLTITYSGKYGELKGFYKSSYKGADGKKKLMATTQFEPTAARLALPCWDEPAFKATFSVKLVVPEGLKAISNMPVIEETKQADGLVEHKYDVTPVMSTYLLAFVIGDFDYLEGTTSEGTKVRVYTPLGKKELGAFGLDVALKCLPYFARYFDISYPLPKCDLLAIPDFASGAMENWGCVTFRENLLLHDPASSSLMQKQYVALVVAHELAHQWFGNIVTMEWWTHLWLNEGFATWIEYLAVDHIFPEWHIWQQFVSIDMSRSLNLDGLENSHPIEVEVKNANEIDEIFDAISYSKGSCAIRLLVAYLGEENFRRGMAVYLKRYKYSNAFTTDLWRTLAESTGKPVEKVMQSWTRETGYPVIKVTEKNGGLELSQVRFLSARPVTPEQDPTIWAVPISVTCAVAGKKEAVTVETLLTERTGTLALPAGVQWLKLNSNQTGHYRVQYPPAMLAKIISAISSNDPRLTEEDKLGIQDDAFSLVRCGLMEIDSLLSLVHAFKSQRGFTLWADLSKNLAGLANILKHTDLSDPFDEFQIQLVEEAGREIGWTKRQGEDHLTTLLRTVLIGKLAVLGDDATVTEALSRFDRFVASLKSDPEEKEAKRSDILPADLRDAVFRVVVKQRGAEGYEQILSIYRTSDSSEEKERALRALPSASDHALLLRTLDFALTDEVRSADAFMPIQAVFDNRHGTHVGFNWLQTHWDELVKRFGGSFQLGRMISGLTAFASHADAENVEGFFKNRPAPAAERQVQQTIEKIKSNADWLSRDAATVRSFLEKGGFIERAAKHTRKLAPLRVLVTGAAGQIAYSLIPILCSGSVFGPDQPIILHLLDIEVAQKALQGVVMEIQDAGYPLVTDIVATAAVEEAFKGVQVAILLGGFPRGKGMTRADLMSKNSPIFVAHGTALNQYADRNVKVLVVANPANTNCLVAASKAPNIPKENFSALTRLDQNRANAQLSARLRVQPGRVQNAVIWGNHSKTMVPDATLARVAPTGESVVAFAERELKVPAADTQKWLREEFVPIVQNRGTSVIETRGASSALSAARASADHVRTWWNGTAPDEVTSMAVYSNGEYGAPKGVFFSFPVRCQPGGTFQVVPDLKIDQVTRALLEITGEELLAERGEALPGAQ